MTTILIVDDNEQNLYLLQALLKGHSFQVATATNGAEALRTARRTPPDMVVSDILMPVMDGFTLCRQWKADEQLKNIPFVLFTATYTEPKDEEFAYSLGADRFIIKPQEPDALISQLREVLAEVQVGKLETAREQIEEGAFLKNHNQALFRKLEDKLAQLEATNVALQRDIAERTHAEEQLRLVSRAVEQSPISVIITDSSGNIQYVNPKFTQVTGYALSEVIGQNPRFPTTGHPLLEGYKDLWDTLTTGQEWHGTLLNKKKDGDVFWESASISPVTDASGAITHFVAVQEDITERKRAEQEIQRRDSILEAVSLATSRLLRAADWRQEILNVLGVLGQAAASDRSAMIELNTDSQGIVRASVRDAWDATGLMRQSGDSQLQDVDVFGIELGPVLQRLAQKQPVYYHSKDLPTGQGGIESSTGLRSALHLPIFVHGDVWGTLHFATIQQEREWSKPELDALQIAADMLGTVMERKEAEDSLQQYAARLRALHQIDRAILVAASPEEIARAALQRIRQLIPCQYALIGIVDFATDRRVLLAADVNGAPLEQPGSRYPLDLHGLETFDQGQPYVIADLQAFPNPPSGFQELLDRGLRSLVSLPLMVHDEILGSLDLLANAPDLFTDDYLEIAREVTDQLAIAIENARLYEQAQRHAAELEQRVQERTAQLGVANEELRALSRVKDEFVSNVSHELRTPVTNINLRHFLLAKQPDRLDVHLPVLQRETSRLARIIDDLLTLSRMDQDRTTFKLTSLDLSVLAQQFVADRVSLAENRGITLASDCIANPLPVEGDAGLLEQALSVLLTNALNYTPSGGQVTVSTMIQQFDNQWWTGFSVRDTGAGIPNEEQARLFTRFFRGEVGRASGVSGTGLGLAIAKEIVDRHQGRITVESEGAPGKGATFSVWLPAAAETPD